MGQVSSVSSTSKDPVQISSLLNLVSFQITSIDDSKIKFKTNPINNVILINSSNLLKYTQNEDFNEFPFLINVKNDDILKFSFKLIKTTKITGDLTALTIFKSVKAFIYDEYNDQIKESLIFNYIQLVNDHKTTVDPSIVQILQTNADLIDFRFELELKKLIDLEKNGKISVIVKANRNDDEEETLLRFAVFVEEELFSKKSTIKKSLLTKDIQSSLNSLSVLENGLNFQNELNSFESSLNSIQPIIKKIIKKSEDLNENLRSLAIIRSSISNSLLELNQLFSSNNSLNNIVFFELIKEISITLTEESRAEIDQSNNLSKYLINPLLSFYNSELKNLKVKKHLYNDELLEFYNNDKNNDLDNGLTKIKEFQLKRLDYFSYLNEFKKGYQIRNLIFNLANYYQNDQSNEKINNLVLNNSLRFFDDYQEYKLNQEILKNAIRNSQTIDDLNKLFQDSSSSKSYQVKRRSYIQQFSNSVPQPIDKEYIVHKCDILYLLDNETKAWEKRYVILKDNLLQEYKVSTANSAPSKFIKINNSSLADQFNLTNSNIIKFKTKKKGKYCFQILNQSKGINKIYQVYNENEQESWSRLLNSSVNLKTFQNDRVSSIITQQTKEFNPSQESLNNFHSISSPRDIITDIDLSNRICCDCGKSESVDWLSLRHLVTICQDCAQAHKVLDIGMVISMINDPRFRIKEVKDLMFHVSNKIANSYWIGSLPFQFKIESSCSYEDRLQFIRRKYIEKLFREIDTKFKPNDSLIKGIKTQNVSLVLKAICFDADLSLKVVQKNSEDKIFDLSLLEFSIHNYNLNDDKLPVFIIPQLLLFNGVPIGNRIKNVLLLNQDQIDFWNSKITENLKNLSEHKRMDTKDSNQLSKKNTLPRGNSDAGKWKLKKSNSVRSVANEKDGKKRNRLDFFRKKNTNNDTQ